MSPHKSLRMLKDLSHCKTTQAGNTPQCLDTICPISSRKLKQIQTKFFRKSIKDIMLL